MKKIILALIFILACTPAFATTAKEEKIAKLMEAQGLKETFQQQLELGKKQGAEYGERIKNQFLEKVTPTEEIKEQLSVAMTEYLEALEPPYTAEEIVSIWSEIWGQYYTEEEIDQLLQFYTSDIAQKDIIQSRKALAEMTHHFSEKNKVIFEGATNKYIEQLKNIITTARDKKKQ